MTAAPIVIKFFLNLVLSTFIAIINQDLNCLQFIIAFKLIMKTIIFIYFLEDLAYFQ